YPQVEGLRLHGTIIEGRFVGGDYYDFIQLSANSVLLLVGDVSGKGVPAALIMSGVRASARLSASMKTGLEELVFRLNEMLHESSPTSPDFSSYFAPELAVRSKRQITKGIGNGRGNEEAVEWKTVCVAPDQSVFSAFFAKRANAVRDRRSILARTALSLRFCLVAAL